MIKNYIYIDGANLYQWSKSWWKIDYKKFYRRLKDKYKAHKIYIFLWYLDNNIDMYSKLSENWYILIFKETMQIDWKTKWNCDTELAVKSTSNYYEEETKDIILVTWDWDFGCIIDFFLEKWCNIKLLAPNKKYCSYLLKKKNIPITMLEEVKNNFTKNPQ